MREPFAIDAIVLVASRYVNLAARIRFEAVVVHEEYARSCHIRTVSTPEAISSLSFDLSEAILVMLFAGFGPCMEFVCEPALVTDNGLGHTLLVLNRLFDRPSKGASIEPLV